MSEKPVLFCSFCDHGSDNENVFVMIQGRSGNICGACVKVCVETIYKHKLKVLCDVLENPKPAEDNG